eukprot:128176_1
MSRVVNVIKFRLLAETLSTDEFHQFIFNTIQTSGRDFILQSLSHLGMNNANANNQHLTNMIHSISDIIQSRETKQDERISNVDQVPSIILGEIASYLNQYDYIHFSRSNRAIYIGCNSPNTLQCLDLLSTHHYALLNLTLYPSIQSLSLKLHAFHELNLMNIEGTIANKLQNLLLISSADHKLDITSFLQQNTLNISNVRSVSLEHIGSMQNPLGGEMFSQLLCLFPMMTRLRLLAVTVNHTELKQLCCPNLNTLALMSTNVQNAMLDAFGKQLECLVMDNFMGSGNNFGALSHTNFKTLRKLFAILPTSQALASIWETAKSMTDVNIIPKGFGNQLMSDVEVSSVISEIVMKQSELSGLYIGIDSDKCHLMVDGIESGLFKTRHCDRSTFKIWFNMNMDFGSIPHETFIIYISRIINALSTANIEQFALIWEISFAVADTVIDYQKEMMKTVCYFVETSPHVKLIESNASRTVIGNVKCKMANFVKFWNWEPGTKLNFHDKH